MTLTFKKIRLIVIAIIAIFILGTATAVFFILKEKRKTSSITPKTETLIEKQLRELDELRGDKQPLTQEEINQQLKELDALRDKKSLPKVDIQKQSAELDNLRNLPY